MLPYIFFILLTTVLSFFFDRQEEYKGRKKAWYIIVGVYLVLLAGLRNGVGGDTQYYMEAFEYVPTNSSEYLPYISQSMLSSGYMPGWTILNIICKHLFNSFYAVQLTQALIVNIGILYLFRQYTTHIFLCTLLYGISYVFFLFNMEVMREAIAVVLCGIGMHCYLRGEKWKFYLLVGISILFHISALIVLLFPFVRLRKINIQIMIMAFIASLSLFLLSDVVVNYLPSLLESTINPTVEKIFMYLGITLNLFGFLENTIQYLVINAGIVFFAQWSLGEDEQKQKDYAKYMSFYLIITILICGFIGFSRFRNYTLIFFLIMLTEFIYHYKSQLYTNAIIKLIVLAGFVFYTSRYYMTYYPGSHGYKYEFYYPYTSIFDENVDTSKREGMHEEANVKVDYSRQKN